MDVIKGPVFPGCNQKHFNDKEVVAVLFVRKVMPSCAYIIGGKEGEAVWDSALIGGVSIK